MSDPTPGPSHISSTRPRQKRKQLTINEKKIALKLYNFIEKTPETYPYKSEIAKMTGDIMGVSDRTIRRIVLDTTEQKTIKPERPPNRSIVKLLDDFTLSAIRRKIHQFYYNGEIPTISKITMAVNDDDTLPSFSKSTINKIMKKLNFKYCKRSRRGIFLDRPDLQIWRKNYLLKIANYRSENRKIYYMDETWLNEGHTCSYVWVDNSIESSRDAFLKGLTTGLRNPSKGKRLIIVHIGSEDGFLKDGEMIFEAKKSDGDYHGEMDAHNFEKWFDNVLKKVEPGSVIVMDNAPYHSRLIERVPNMSWRKADIQTWLQEKEIQFEINEIKAELLTKINKDNYNTKYVDELAASRGIIVLRLPPYHCELNPIELIWAQVKGYVGHNNKTHKMEDLKILLMESMARITAISWQKCIEHVLNVEEKMKSLDGILDKASDEVDEFIIYVGGSTTSTETETDSNKEN